MTLSTPSKVALLAATILAFTIPSAFAAQSATAVKVRSGPGTSYRIVSYLAEGQRAQIQQQHGSWCYVVKSGPDGWVKCSYLGDGPNRQSRYVREPSVSLQFSFGTTSRRDRTDRNSDWDNGPGHGNGGWENHDDMHGPRDGDWNNDH